MFLLDWGKKEKRLDPAYYIPSIVELEDMVRARCGNVRLNHYIKQMAGGATPKVEDSTKYATSEDGVPFVRVQNLTSEGVFDLDDVKYISQDTHKYDLKRSAFCDQDLVVKITGVGRMAVASIPPVGFCGNINQHSVKIVTGSREISETLAAYLNLDFVEKLASRRATGGTRPALDYPALRSIPIIFDERIAKMMSDAREQKEKAELQAQQLLDSIDGYLLKELGIVPPIKPVNILSNRKFKRGFFDVSGKRFDPFYHLKYFDDLLCAIKSSYFTTSRLSNNVSLITSGSRPKGGIKQIENGVLSLGGEHVNRLSQIEIRNPKYIPVEFHNATSKQHTKLHDIIFVKDGATTGKIGIIEKTDHTNVNINEHVFIIRLNGMDHHYVTYLLNTDLYQNLIKREITGSTVTGISKTFTREIIIPVPPKVKQEEISKNIIRIREQAFVLKQYADDEFKKSIRNIENLILTSKN